jgi:hypothetical protein
MSIYLLVDGIRVAPETSDQDLLTFRLDLPVREIRLISGHASPLDLAGIDDPRRLGVALCRMYWRQDDKVLDAPVSSPGFIDGFHSLEHYNDEEGPFRWTNGNAALPPDLFPSWRGVAHLHLRLIRWQGSTVQAPPKPEAALLSAFESLGENCDLAIAQRHYGVEQPLTLLRWAGTSYDKLLRGLANGFDGIGDPGSTEVVWNVIDYRLRTPYLSFHTGANQPLDAEGVAEVLRSGCATLRLLRRKLLHDIAGARRIFVFRSMTPDFGPIEMRNLHAALHVIGPASLLCIAPPEPDQSGGGVEQLGDGLYLGHLENFPASSGPFDDWLALCSRVLALHYAS